MASITPSLITLPKGCHVKLGGGMTGPQHGALFASYTTATFWAAPPSPRLVFQLTCGCLGWQSLKNASPAAFSLCVRGGSQTRLRVSNLRAAALADIGWSSAAREDADVDSLKAACDCESVTGPTERRNCLKCLHAKPLADFEKTKTSLDGRTDTCRACMAAIKAERSKSELYHLALSVEASWEQGKVCRACGDFKEARDYSRAARQKDGLYYYCRGCMSKKNDAFSERVPMEVPRRCSGCGEVRAAGDFHRRKGSLRTQCKACEREYSIKRDLLLASSSIVVPREGKMCTTCGQFRATKFFYRNKRGSDGLLSTCKPCHNGAQVARARAGKPMGSLSECEPPQNVRP